MKSKYYKLNNGFKIEYDDVIASYQGKGYFVLYFASGSSLQQKGLIEIVEE